MKKLIALGIMTLTILACGLIPSTASPVNIETAIAGTQTAMQAQATFTPSPTSTPSYTRTDYLQDAENLLYEWSNANSAYTDFLLTESDNLGGTEFSMEYVEKITDVQKAGEGLGKLNPPTEDLRHLDRSLKSLSDEIILYVNNENAIWIDQKITEESIQVAETHLERIVDLYGLALDELRALKY